jgi:ElaB/YqjD/DUF883 family membrane-anchored ribosome-binding protein
VDSELEVIRDEMEQTRANLADKLGALESQVRETVSGATDAVSSTVEGVKGVVETVSETVESVAETFNLSKQVEQHPWMAFGAAVAVGFVAAQVFERWGQPSPPPAPPPPAPMPPASLSSIPLQPMHQPAPATEPARGESHGESESLLGSLGHSALESLKEVLPDTKEVMNTVVSSASSLAVGSLMGLIRELAATQLPAEWQGEATKLIDQVTTQLGGKPKPAWEKAPEPPAQPTHQAEQGIQSQPSGTETFREEKRQEGAPFDTQQQSGNGGSREKRGRGQTSRQS